MEIANKLTSKGITFASLLKGETTKRKIDGEEVELIAYENLERVISGLGVKSFGLDERRCLKNIQPEQLGNNFKVADIVQILDDFIAHEEFNDLSKEMNFDELSPISMVLLLALAEYLASKNINAIDLFTAVIYKQPVQVDNEQYELDVIDSSDFFHTITTVGIETSEADHDNLKTFLAIDLGYLDKLSLDKLNAAIRAFTTDEQLRAKAHRYYKELISEESS
eukprot:TRINITY_DN22641_c0_g1_i1.p2 TRINITY_DN22641_c0_g1~~TRINITY_DN22641_c0_g1_i1.p2  ORF type:complete len:223 (+),score=57.64 TRINITY_DN22641_c0_g1_i1:309-977(+)